MELDQGAETKGISDSVLLDIPRENSQRTLTLWKRKWIRCWHTTHKNVLLSRKMYFPRDCLELQRGLSEITLTGRGHLL